MDTNSTIEELSGQPLLNIILDLHLGHTQGKFLSIGRGNSVQGKYGYRTFENSSPTSPQKIQQWGWPLNYPKYFSRKISSYNDLHRALLRPKNRASFIKVSNWRNHFRENFVSEKMFATMHLRKKMVSNFRNSGSGIRIWTIHFPDFNFFLNPITIWIIRSKMIFWDILYIRFYSN